MKKLLSIAISILFLVISFHSVYAMNSPSNAMSAEDRQKMREEKQAEMDARKADLEQKRQELEQNREARIEERCENTQARVQERIDRFYANREMHIERYNEVTSKLESISARLEAEGLDVSGLNVSIQAHKRNAERYAQNYSNFISQLESSKELACGESDRAYKEALKAARSTLMEARQQRFELRVTYGDEIRNTILDLRSQLIAQEGESNE